MQLWFHAQHIQKVLNGLKYLLQKNVNAYTSMNFISTFIHDKKSNSVEMQPLF